MFQRAGHLIYRLRFLIVVAWVVAAGVCAALAPDLAEVGSADQSRFLPANVESVAARDALARAFPAEASAGVATIAFSRPEGLTDADHRVVADTGAWLISSAPEPLGGAVSRVIETTSHPELATRLRSADGTVELLSLELSVGAFDPGARELVDQLREHLATSLPAGLTANVTGNVGISVDYLASIIEATDRTTAVTVLLVILVLLAIYRAPLAALVPLATIGAAFLVSRGVLGYLAEAGWEISSLLGTFVVVLVFGVGTDYTIFLISRFREEVHGRAWVDAIGRTVGRIGAVITASAATVAIGLGSMVVGQFVMFQTTGPALAITILVTLAAGLTLAPALLAIFGHYLFWPRHGTGVDRSGRGLFGRLATLIGRRPILVTVVVLVALALPAGATTGLRQSFDVLADLPASSDSKAGFDLVADKFDAGQLLPIEVVVEGDAGSDLDRPAWLSAVRATTDRLLATEGILRVESLVAPSGDGLTPAGFRPSASLADMAERFAVSADPAEALRKLLDPKTSDGIRAAEAYLVELAGAYPDVATTRDFEQSAADLDRMPKAIDELRKHLRVSTQLDQLAAMITAAAASGAPIDAWLVPLDGYLGSLATAYPAVTAHPAFIDATSALLSASAPPEPGRMAADVAALAAAFEAQPDAILVPPASAAEPATTALQREIAETGARLPAELDRLADAFRARSDDYLVPTGSGEEAIALQAIRDAYLSADGTVTRLYATMRDDPFSTAAFDSVTGVRAAMAAAAPMFEPGTRILVGGQTALEVDLQSTINADFANVAALTVLGVLVVLVLLLRSLVAPLYLVGTVLLSYLCTLGLTSVLFQDVLGHPGMNYFLPLMVFVLLVALGSDYNIFLMSRVREESDAHGTRDGIRIASARTGAVITSAGVILAGTFLAMIASPLTVLFQVGVIVALGVLIDTFVVRSLLVPAITTVLGNAAWWPFGGRTPRGPEIRAPGSRPGPEAPQPGSARP